MIVYKNKSALKINPILYGVMVLASMLQFFAFKDLMWGVISLNLALIFDPFNPKQTWNDRPSWQRTWLIVHVTAGIGILVFLALQKIW